MICELLDSAVRNHQAGRLDDAGRLYEEILQTDPNHPDALHLLGLLAHQRGEHQRAAEQIGRAISVNPNAADYYSNLAAAHRALGNLEKAVGNCRNAVRIDPDHAQSYNNLGAVLIDQGKFDDAETNFRRALEINPRNAEALNGLGNALKHQAKLEEAMERHVEESLRKLKGFTISENLALFRAGEKTGECVFRANSRVANAVKSVFGVEVPKSRMYSVAKHNFGHADAMATLVNAGIEKKFLSHAKRPGPGRKPQWHRPAK